MSSDSSKGVKRKAWDVKDKLAAIDRVNQGESQAKVARDLQVAESTLRGWLKDATKLRDFVHAVDESSGLSRKKMRRADDLDLDTVLYKWFVQQQASGVPLSGAILQAQAEKFAKSVNGADTSFKASQGWLSRFKQRHGIGQISISGEIRSADDGAANAYPAELKKIIDAGGYVAEQIYNADETGVYYKMLPDKTLAIKSDEHRKEGFKSIKERVTLLFTVNKTGSHKLKPLLIGKSMNPRCLHHVNRKSLPLIYTSSKNAWMTSDIFQEWFNDHFVPAVRKHLRSLKLPERAILLLDNCPAHPPADLLKSRDGQISVVYLPKNTTSLIQPLDQGIIATFKKNYRRELVSSIVNGDRSVTEFLKSLSIKDFIYLASTAWNAVLPKTIEGCWMRGLRMAFEMPVADNEDTAEPAASDQPPAAAGGSDDDDDEFLGFSDDDINKVST